MLSPPQCRLCADDVTNSSTCRAFDANNQRLPLIERRARVVAAPDTAAAMDNATVAVSLRVETPSHARMEVTLYERSAEAIGPFGPVLSGESAATGGALPVLFE